MQDRVDPKTQAAAGVATHASNVPAPPAPRLPDQHPAALDLGSAVTSLAPLR